MLPIATNGGLPRKIYVWMSIDLFISQVFYKILELMNIVGFLVKKMRYVYARFFFNGWSINEQGIISEVLKEKNIICWEELGKI